MKSSEVTTTVSGRKKESSNEVVHVECERKLTWWPWRCSCVEDAWHLGFSCDFLFCVIFHRIFYWSYFIKPMKITEHQNDVYIH